MTFRKATINDLEGLKALGIKAWSPYKNDLAPKHWNSLWQSLSNDTTYTDLLKISETIVCEDEEHNIIGMAFLVPTGNPTDIYDVNWCYLRFVSVDPAHQGKAIGITLTKLCIDRALKNNETVMALHTSEIMYGARHIYEKLGFRILKAIPPRLGIKYWLYTLDLKDYE